MGVGIQVDKLNAWFGKTQALYDINMTVAANHATAVIGPSGCGKSTFVRCLQRDLSGADSPPHRHGFSKAESVSHHEHL